MFERTRNFLTSLGLGGLVHPKGLEVEGSRSADVGLYDQATDAGPYVGVRVPPPEVAGASPLAPPRPPQRGYEVENAIASMCGEVATLRQDLGVVLTEFLIAGGTDREAAGKFVSKALATPRGISELDFGTGIERFQSELIELRRQAAIVMFNLLTKSDCPRDVASRIAVVPLLPKAAKADAYEDFEGQELEMQRFKKEVDRLCDRIFGATEIGGQQAVSEIRPSAHEPEKRPGPAATRDRSRDRGHEW
jgi:hypothetical protein